MTAPHTIDPAALAPEAAYRLMTGIVVPRPIAWITSIDRAGRVNLAPFSCYTFVSNSPVMVGISIGRKPTRRKDTAANIRACGEFVVNVAQYSSAADVHHSAKEHEPGVSEVELLGLAVRASERVLPPCLADVPIALECTLESVHEFGTTRTEFIVGRVQLIHVRHGLLENGRIDTIELQPLGRIAGPNYTRVDSAISFAALHQSMAGASDGKA